MWAISESRNGFDITIHFEDKNICVKKKKMNCICLLEHFYEFIASGGLAKTELLMKNYII